VPVPEFLNGDFSKLLTIRDMCALGTANIQLGLRLGW